MNKRAAIVLTGVLLCLLAVGGTMAQGPTTIDWWVTSSGGSPSIGNGDIVLNDTIGQVFTGPLNSGSVSLEAGYWYSAAGQRYTIYLPLTLRNLR